MAGDEVVLRATGLRKRFRHVVALDGLDLAVPKGCVYGLLGPNGSGKTTTIRILLGLLSADAGEASLFGEPSSALPWRTRQRIGYLSEEPFPYDRLPIEDLLLFVSAFFERWDWTRARDLLRKMDVPRDRTLERMSPGQRRKAELLLALAQDPDLLVLDDPALGLDTATRQELLYSALELARNEGKTVVFTSHVLHDVERIVDRVGFLCQGRLKREATIAELRQKTKRIFVSLRDPGVASSVRFPGEVNRQVRKTGVELVTTAYDPEAAARLAQRFPKTSVEDLDLEEIYLVVTSNGASEKASP